MIKAIELGIALAAGGGMLFGCSNQDETEEIAGFLRGTSEVVIAYDDPSVEAFRIVVSSDEGIVRALVSSVCSDLAGEEIDPAAQAPMALICVIAFLDANGKLITSLRMGEGEFTLGNPPHRRLPMVTGPVSKVCYKMMEGITLDVLARRYPQTERVIRDHIRGFRVHGE